jgi:hypothetical protein
LPKRRRPIRQRRLPKRRRPIRQRRLPKRRRPIRWRRWFRARSRQGAAQVRGFITTTTGTDMGEVGPVSPSNRPRRQATRSPRGALKPIKQRRPAKPRRRCRLRRSPTAAQVRGPVTTTTGTDTGAVRPVRQAAFSRRFRVRLTLLDRLCKGRRRPLRPRPSHRRVADTRGRQSGVSPAQRRVSLFRISRNVGHPDSPRRELPLSRSMIQRVRPAPQFHLCLYFGGYDSIAECHRFAMSL